MIKLETDSCKSLRKYSETGAGFDHYRKRIPKSDSASVKWVSRVLSFCMGDQVVVVCALNFIKHNKGIM